MKVFSVTFLALCLYASTDVSAAAKGPRGAKGKQEENKSQKERTHRRLKMGMSSDGGFLAGAAIGTLGAAVGLTLGALGFTILANVPAPTPPPPPPPPPESKCALDVEPVDCDTRRFMRGLQDNTIRDGGPVPAEPWFVTLEGQPGSTREGLPACGGSLVWGDSKCF